MLVFVMAACFFGELSYVKPPAVDVMKGMFIPKLSGQGATGDAIALLGALVMPHNLFLHSALVLSRKIPNSVRGTNVIISVSGTICLADDISKDNAVRCSDLTLNSASFLLKNVLGRSSSTVYAIALLASGQSSTITGTYAGLLGSQDEKMAQKFDDKIIVVSWILGLGIIGINIYYLSTAFVDWLIHNDLPRVGNVFIGIIVFPLMAIYILSVVYLMFRKDKVVTFIDPTKFDPIAQTRMENGNAVGDGGIELQTVPYREDLADIPLPR
ncbi:hypothetical protein BUALT_Bualt08G0111400 [Buddleja alternifolia]|uniref:Uncharacterized protein n=1 Tax=Buddleja alternifolia TaxID=168488 RepID=A0AAV6X6N4_9LAMI|nr:hypothetical protein BUALT_Bualt08G0111400 [Buddleja alternifolia]